ncbi:hypothetical protein H6P81_008440 [Aristolochia fimbriata]|uniref:Uncharacterized protein n=1 Tax=Aristolochia fimbriata TaxID=158543 RepID=A0AAV7EI03_ARIFI|nr:hypothetical protein H6P81_008440 [Aristolochia fimbriata]
MAKTTSFVSICLLALLLCAVFVKPTRADVAEEASGSPGAPTTVPTVAITGNVVDGTEAGEEDALLLLRQHAVVVGH